MQLSQAERHHTEERNPSLQEEEKAENRENGNKLRRAAVQIHISVQVMSQKVKRLNTIAETRTS